MMSHSKPQLKNEYAVIGLAEKSDTQSGKDLPSPSPWNI
jgi:hypothetical protein